jgi:microcystin degradation protein MlrC
MKPRILFGGLFHETHTFLGETTGWDDFEVQIGAPILAKLGDGSPTDGFLTEAQRQGWEVIPTIDARCAPSGTVTDAMFERYWDQFARLAAPALAAGVDAIYLVLHGAMATETFRDTEGELLGRIRSLPGAQTVPIFGVLDLHGNISARMCRSANGLVMYRENPHTDARDSAVRGAELLARCLRERQVPRMVWCRPPILWAPPGTGTHADPMKSLESFARKLEAEHPEVWACNIAGGYSFADTPDTGCSICVITTLPEAAAREHLRAGAALAWSLRKQGTIVYPGVDEVLCGLREEDFSRGPVLLVEPADNIGGGAPGDCTGVLRALLRHMVAPGLVVISDPLAVAALAKVEPGEVLPLSVGGRGSPLDEGPVELEATFVSRSDGNFTLEDPNSHLASMNGLRIAMGPSAVITSAGVTILLTSRKTAPFDLGQLRSQGIEPTRFRVIGVKAAVAHKRAYDRISQTSFYVDTPGPCTSNIGSLPWRQLVRPVYPLDEAASGAPRFS